MVAVRDARDVLRVNEGNKEQKDIRDKVGVTYLSGGLTPLV